MQELVATTELESLTPGTRLEDFSVLPTRSQVFMFSAITWNRHGIHFDKDQALSEGFPDVAVQRGLIGNFLATHMAHWSGTRGRLERLQWKVTKSAFPNEELRSQGLVKRICRTNGSTDVTCELRVLNSHGDQVALGEARVRFDYEIDLASYSS